jgi:hypothetical protein
MLSSVSRGDFVLQNNEELTVTGYHSEGYLYDTSSLHFLGQMDKLFVRDSSIVNISGGSVDYLYAQNSSTVDMFGGRVLRFSTYDNCIVNYMAPWPARVTGFYIYNNSTVNVSSGQVTNIFARGSSTVNFSGERISWLETHNTSTVNFSGERLIYLYTYDDSTVNLSGGSLYRGYTYGNSTVNMLDVSVEQYFWVYDDSTVNISGGEVPILSISHNSTVNISDGLMNTVRTYGNSFVNVSGGQVDSIKAYYNSTVTFIGRDFYLGDGLSLDGNRILGIGYLSGKWYDGTYWMTSIDRNDDYATIQIIPEPITLSLLLMGGLVVLVRRRN